MIRILFVSAMLGAAACAASAHKEPSQTPPPDESGGHGGSSNPQAGRGGAQEDAAPAETPAGGQGGSAPDAAATVADASSADASRKPDAPPSVPPASPGACAKLLGQMGPASQWVSWDANGKLVYKALNAQGDRIMDFSHAGYRGGGVALPDVPVQVTLSPSGGDDTAAIQAALDQVSMKPLVGGFRGAVLLKAGQFKSSTTHVISASGVVLRGSGAGMGGTEIQLTGTPHRFLDMQGSGTRTVDAASKTTITDAYVPAGARSFTVASAAAFKVGDQVLVGRPVTEKWISFMGMDKLVRNGAAQTWIKAGTVLSAERVITAINGNEITVDAPLADSMDGQYVTPPGGTLTKFTFERLSEIGVEHLRVVGQPRAPMVDFSFLQMNTVVDCWVKDVVAHDVTSGVSIVGNAKRITIADTVISHTTVDYVTSAKPADFNIDGLGQVLIHRSSSKGSNQSFSAVTGSGVPGPTVLLDFTVSGINPPIQPHQRWATGVLVDNASLESGSIDFIDRNILGSGHGWTVGWAVAWNSTAKTFHIQQPPGAMNWAIGCKGAEAAPTGGHPNGTFESLGTPVNIKSLYLAQLCERLGPQALGNIGP